MIDNRLLVIGGTGFIGRHICIEAQKRGYAVTSLSLNKVEEPLQGVCYLKGDISHLQNIGELEEGLKFEYVINAAGYVDHRNFWSGGNEVIDIHFNGAKNLIALCDRTVLKRFVQIGSSDEYGVIPAPQSEDSIEKPISPYSLAKVSVTHLLQMLWRSESFPAVILRFFLVYGPRQGTNRFLPHLILGCLRNKAFSVSAGLQQRDFCYVDDIVKGVLEALQSPGVCGEIINLASGRPITIRHMTEHIRGLIGTGEPLFGKVPYRKGESMALYADIKKAKLLMNWEPQISLDEGLKETIDWYRRRENAD